MAFLTRSERIFLQAVSNLGYCNPFLPERIDNEREALGRDFIETTSDWIFRGGVDPPAPDNRLIISERIDALMPKLQERLAEGSAAKDDELILYQDAVLFLLYYRYQFHFWETIQLLLEGKPGRFDYYRDFLKDWRYYFETLNVTFPEMLEASHLFACFFQIARAFRLIFLYIIGGSPAAILLRAEVWQSIFTHDLRRYRDALYDRMGDVTTLITGPSGTGKELVARAIGLSRYISFDPKKMEFTSDFTQSFHPLNLSALPSTLIESELFGHKKGAFTGALQDRRGWLDVCGPKGTVFLDEVGDLDPSVQVKLLRVLQSRTFQPVGDTKERQFQGKIIAATNHDLANRMEEGNFRKDFYYRLCSDQIVTPSLYEQLQESPSELRGLLVYIARYVAGNHADELADEAEKWIEEKLGRDYTWPGNFRELEQCVRSVLIRKEYHPPRARTISGPNELLDAASHETITADELLRRYCTMVYIKTGSYEETARKLHLDSRTVKKKVDPHLLD